MITELAPADAPRAASLFAAFTHDRARLESYLSVGDARSVTGDTRVLLQPIAMALAGGQPFVMRWSAGGPWRPQA